MASSNDDSQTRMRHLEEMSFQSRFPKESTFTTHKMRYGEFIILGYNGQLPEGDRGRRRSKIELCRRGKANGIIKSRQYKLANNLINASSSSINADKDTYSISYQMKDHSVIVEYCKDENTDIFQIGRSSESPIDFVVLDTIPGGKIVDRNIINTPQTISRFACRILASREASNSFVEVFAAGFDSSKRIFLGNNATIWQKWSLDDACIHGLTTNGVLMMKPIGVFCDNFDKDANFRYVSSYTNKRKSPIMPGTWREVSVDGNIFGRREPRSAIVEGIPVPTEDNVLTDGTLIDLCGATLIWRSLDGISRSPKIEHLKTSLRQLDELKMWPNSILDMVLPKTNPSNRQIPNKENDGLYVCIQCGHVQKTHNFNCLNVKPNYEYCPYCRTKSQFARLCLGIETGFYVDFGPPLFCFVPCGHMVNEETARYWASVPIPCIKSGFYSACPFCATPLDGNTGYTKLVFSL